MPTPTTKTTQSYAWTDAAGTASAEVDVTDVNAPILETYQVLDSNGLNLFINSAPTAAQVQFLSTFFSDLNTILTPVES